MGKIVFWATFMSVSSVLAVPSTYNDLGSESQVVNDFWDTRGRAEVAVDVSTGTISTEVSSVILTTWDCSSVINIWSTPFAGFLLYLR